MDNAPDVPADVGVRDCKGDDRSDLVVVSVLDARLLQSQLRSVAPRARTADHRHLPARLYRTPRRHDVSPYSRDRPPAGAAARACTPLNLEFRIWNLEFAIWTPGSCESRIRIPNSKVPIPDS